MNVQNVHFTSYRLALENVVFLMVVEFHKVKFITGFLLQREQITDGKVLHEVFSLFTYFCRENRKVEIMKGMKAAKASRRYVSYPRRWQRRRKNAF